MYIVLGGSKIPTKMQPKMLVVLVLRTTEHLEFSLILQKQSSKMWSPHCIEHRPKKVECNVVKPKFGHTLRANKHFLDGIYG